MSDTTLSSASLSADVLLDKTFSFNATNHSAANFKGFLNDASDLGITVNGVSFEGDSLAQPIQILGLSNNQILVNVNNRPIPDIANGIEYQWKRDGVNLTGETSSSYTLDSDDIGKSITLTATYTNTLGQEVTLQSQATAPIAPADGQALTIVYPVGRSHVDNVYYTETLKPVDKYDSNTFQVTKNGAPIPLTSANRYNFTALNEGDFFNITASWRDENGNTQSTSRTIGPLLGAMPAKEISVDWVKYPMVTDPNNAEKTKTHTGFTRDLGPHSSVADFGCELYIDGVMVDSLSFNLDGSFEIGPEHEGKPCYQKIYYKYADESEFRYSQTETVNILPMNTIQPLVAYSRYTSNTNTPPGLLVMDTFKGTFGEYLSDISYKWIVNGTTAMDETIPKSITSAAAPNGNTILEVGDVVQAQLTYYDSNEQQQDLYSQTLTIVDQNNASFIETTGTPTAGSTLNFVQSIADNNATAITYKVYENGDNDTPVQTYSSLPEITMQDNTSYKIAVEYTNSKNELVVLESPWTPTVENKPFLQAKQNSQNRYEIVVPTGFYDADNDVVDFNWTLQTSSGTTSTPTLYNDKTEAAVTNLNSGDVLSASITVNGVTTPAFNTITRTPVKLIPTTPVSFDTDIFVATRQLEYSITYQDTPGISSQDWDYITINDYKFPKTKNTQYDSVTNTFYFDKPSGFTLNTGDIVLGQLKKEFLKKDIFSVVSSDFEATGAAELGAGANAVVLEFTPKSSKNRPLFNFHEQVEFVSHRGLRLRSIKQGNKYVNGETPPISSMLKGLHQFYVEINGVLRGDLGTKNVNFQDLSYDTLEMSSVALTEANPTVAATLTFKESTSAYTGIPTTSIAVEFDGEAPEGLSIGSIYLQGNSYYVPITWDVTKGAQPDVFLNVTALDQGNIRYFTSDLDFVGDRPQVTVDAAEAKDLITISVPDDKITPGAPNTITIRVNDGLAHYGDTSTIEIEQKGSVDPSTPIIGSLTTPVLEYERKSVSVNLADPDQVRLGVVSEFASVIIETGWFKIADHGFKQGQTVFLSKIPEGGQGDDFLMPEGFNILELSVNTPLYIIYRNDNEFALAQSKEEALANRYFSPVAYFNETIDIRSAADTVLTSVYSPPAESGQEVSFRVSLTRPWGAVEYTDYSTFLISTENNVIRLKGGDYPRFHVNEPYVEYGYQLITRDTPFNTPVWEAFGGATANNDTKRYGVPNSAEAWAGFANVESTLQNITFDRGAVITFRAKKTGTQVHSEARFKFERLPYDESTVVDGVAQSTLPSFYTDPVLINSTEFTPYTIVVTPEEGFNTYSSFLMYLTGDGEPEIELVDFQIANIGRALEDNLVSISGSVDTSTTGIDELTYNYLTNDQKKRAVSKVRKVGTVDSFLFWSDDEVTINENITAEDVIYVARASSPHPITYGGNENFGVTVDSQTGEVRIRPDYLNVKADYETQDSYIFQVTATSNNETITKFVYVNVRNVDEIGPWYPGGYIGFNLEVPSGTPPGRIGRIGLTERDYEGTETGLGLIFNELPGTDEAVNVAINGDIFLSVTANANIKDRYTYEATATDLAGNEYSGIITGYIDIGDANLETPTVIGPTDFIMQQNDCIDSYIHDIIIKDLDVKDQGTTVSMVQRSADNTLSLELVNDTSLGYMYKIRSVQPTPVVNQIRSITIEISDGVNIGQQTFTFTTRNYAARITTQAAYTHTQGPISSPNVTVWTGSLQNDHNVPVNGLRTWSLVSELQELRSNSLDNSKGVIQDSLIQNPPTVPTYSIDSYTGTIKGITFTDSSVYSEYRYVYISTFNSGGEYDLLKRIEIPMQMDTTAPVVSTTYIGPQPLYINLTDTVDRNIVKLEISDDTLPTFTEDMILGYGAAVSIASATPTNMSLKMYNFGTEESPDVHPVLYLPAGQKAQQSDQSIDIQLVDGNANYSYKNINLYTHLANPVPTIATEFEVTTSILEVDDILQTIQMLGQVPLPSRVYMFDNADSAQQSSIQGLYNNTSSTEITYTYASGEEIDLELNASTKELKIKAIRNSLGTSVTSIDTPEDPVDITLYLVIQAGDILQNLRRDSTQVLTIAPTPYRLEWKGSEPPLLELLHIHRGNNTNDIGEFSLEGEGSLTANDCTFSLVNVSDGSTHDLHYITLWGATAGQRILKTSPNTQGLWDDYLTDPLLDQNNKFDFYLQARNSTTNELVAQKRVTIWYLKALEGNYSSAAGPASYLDYNIVNTGAEYSRTYPGTSVYTMIGNHAPGLEYSIQYFSVELGLNASLSESDWLNGDVGQTVHPANPTVTFPHPLVHVASKVSSGFARIRIIHRYQDSDTATDLDYNTETFGRIFFLERGTNKLYSGGQVSKADRVGNYDFDAQGYNANWQGGTTNYKPVVAADYNVRPGYAKTPLRENKSFVAVYVSENNE